MERYGFGKPKFRKENVLTRFIFLGFFIFALISLPSVSATIGVVDANQVAYFNMEQGSGTVLTNNWNTGFNCTLSAGIEYNSTVPVFNTSGNGSSFSISYQGVDESCSSTSTGFSLQNKNWTMSVWVRVQATSGTVYISNHGTSASTDPDYGIGSYNIDTDQVLCWSTNTSVGGGRVQFNAPTNMPGGWANLICTWNGTDLAMYVNGTVASINSTPAAPGNPGNLDNQFWIGVNRAGGGGVFNGQIDHYMLWNESVNATQALNLYSYGNVTAPAAADTTAPTFSVNKTNNTAPKINQDVNFSIDLFDETNLSSYIFSYDNGTGTFVNDSAIAIISDMSDTPDSFSCDPTANWNSCSLVADQNFSSNTFDTGSDVNLFVYINYTIPNSVVIGGGSKLEYKADKDSTSTLELYCIDNLDAPNTLVDFPPGNVNRHENVSLPVGCINRSILQLRFNANGNSQDENIHIWDTRVWWNLTTGTNTSNNSVAKVKTIERANGVTIQWRWYANDTTNNWNSSTIESFVVANTVPTILAQNSFTNDSANHSFKVEANATEADGASSIVSTSISTTAGTCQLISNSSGGTSFGVRYNCSGTGLTATTIRIGFKDNASTPGEVNTTASSNTYPNQLPSVASAAINNTSPTDLVDLQCDNGTVSDADPSDTVTLLYGWLKNSADQNINNKVLGNGNTSTNDQWQCQITPYDTIQNGSTKTSASVTINGSNSGPTINWTNATSNNGVNSTSTNPTRNDSFVIFNAEWNDVNNDKITFYSCRSDSANASGCTGITWCSSSANITVKPAQCNYTISGLSNESYTYFAFVIDNNSAISASTSGNFSVNHPPRIANLTFPTNNTYRNISWINFTFNSSDEDSGDTANYTLFADNSTNPTSVIYNSSNEFFNWTPLNETTYYWKIMVADNHGYPALENTSVFNFTADTIVPNISVSSPENSTSIGSKTLTLNFTIIDAHPAGCRFNITKQSSGDSEGLANRTAVCNTSTTVSVDLFTSYILHLYSIDLSNNENTTDIYFTVLEGSGSSSSGGGGGNPPSEPKEIIIIPSVCGNNICDDTETPNSCSADCKVNLDVLFSGELLQTSWFANLVVYSIVGIALLIVVRRQVEFPDFLKQRARKARSSFLSNKNRRY